MNLHKCFHLFSWMKLLGGLQDVVRLCLMHLFTCSFGAPVEQETNFMPLSVAFRLKLNVTVWLITSPHIIRDGYRNSVFTGFGAKFRKYQ